MCGIAGYIGKETIEKPVLHRTLSMMKNRGPDHQDYRYIEQNDTRIYLLHSRLSIVDLDKRSNQPFTQDGCTLIFNGEIYNYIELRGELKKQGIECITTSDTEVLLRYYLLHGEDCVKYFEGMWSFAIYDSRINILFLSRDRFAEKPLYYYETEIGLFFGSEVKFIKQLSNTGFTVNEKQLLRFLVNGYKSLYKQSETFYREIKEIPYATNVAIERDLSLREKQYWHPQYQPRDMTLGEAVEGLREHLNESVRLRLRSDVPLAFCLSGAIDSSGLVSIASRIFNYDVSTYSIIDTDERYNEYENIKATIDDLGCKHTFIALNSKDNLDRLVKLIDYHDGPLSTISYLIHSYISESVSTDGYKVVFSGTGADEMLTGYYDHFNLYLYEMKNRQGYTSSLKDWQAYIRPFVRNPHLQDPEIYFKDTSFRDHIYLNCDVFSSFLKENFQEKFIEQEYSDSLLRNRMLNEMFHEGTRVILHEDDLNSMKYSLENRSPYLDSKLFEFSYSIPNGLLIQNGYGKYVLREAVKGILNDQVRLDRRKKGFNTSIHSVIDFKNKRDREYILDDSPIYQFVDKNKIEGFLDIQDMPNSYSKFLFNFINVKIFLEQNI